MIRELSKKEINVVMGGTKSVKLPTKTSLADTLKSMQATSMIDIGLCGVTICPPVIKK